MACGMQQQIGVADAQTGIILGVVLFFIVAILYIISGYHLVTIYYKSQRVEVVFSFIQVNYAQKGIQTNNDYARLCYIVLLFLPSDSQTMGNAGYIIFNIATIVTLFGMAMGTMVIFDSVYHRQIVMTDFVDGLPISSTHPTLKRAILQGVITIIALVLCLLKDPSLLVGVSSFGLVALVISLIILFIYGLVTYGFKFDHSFWFPRPNGILSNLGVFINSLAFSLMCLSQVVSPQLLLSLIEAFEKDVSNHRNHYNFPLCVANGSDLFTDWSDLFGSL